MDNISREIKDLRKYHGETLEMKNSVTKEKNVFGRFINKLYIAERMFELEDKTIETPKTEKQREKNLTKIAQNIQE
jgi:hypothetical protein